VATGFGFSIPTTATTIKGILVEYERSRTNNNGYVTDYSILIIQGGTPGGTDQSVGATWPTTDAYNGYGGATNLWGLAWTPAQINSANFGVEIKADIGGGTASSTTAYIDHVRITVYYISYNSFWNNIINNTPNGGKNWKTSGENYTNYFNATKVAGTNIIGGSWIAGNYWSDYNGTDTDADGIGNEIYIINETRMVDKLPLMYAAADTCSYSSGTWNVNCADNCIITSSVNLNGNNMFIKGNGRFTLDADIKRYGMVFISGNCAVMQRLGRFKE
jgi:hypothetical protein